jgi:hypothetical protein
MFSPDWPSAGRFPIPDLHLPPASRRRPFTMADRLLRAMSSGRSTPCSKGKIRSTKSAAYRFVDHIEAPDDFTVMFHLKEPNADLAVESLRGSDWDCALRIARRDHAPADRLGTVQICQREQRTRKSSSSSATTITGVQRPPGPGTLRRRARRHHAGARIAQRQRRHRDQCT